jgi:hypothetical protein
MLGLEIGDYLLIIEEITVYCIYGCSKICGSESMLTRWNKLYHIAIELSLLMQLSLI